MGVTESYEDANPTLEVLFNMSNKQVEDALQLLEKSSKEGYQMQVSKWDLIMFTKLEAIKVKLLMKMLTGEKEPTQANIHQVMCSLILSRSGHWSHKDQLRRLFEAISFTLEVGQI
jgi:hypothetical protein